MHNFQASLEELATQAEEDTNLNNTELLEKVIILGSTCQSLGQLGSSNIPNFSCPG